MKRPAPPLAPLFLPFVTATGLLLLAVLLNGWLGATPLGAEYAWMHGEGAWQTTLGFLFESGAPALRIAALVIYALAAAFLGSAAALATESRFASWWVTGLVVVHPFTLAATLDTRWLPWAVVALAAAVFLWSAVRFLGLLGALGLTAFAAVLSLVLCWPTTLGSGMLTAAAEVIAPSCGGDAPGPDGLRRLGFVVPAIGLLVLGHRGRAASDGWVFAIGGLFLLSTCLIAEPVSLAPHLYEAASASVRVLALSWLLGVAAARAWQTPNARWAVGGLASLLLLSGITGSRLGVLEQEVSRREAERMELGIKAIPELKIEATRLLVGAPEGRNGLPGLVEALPWIVPGRPFAPAQELVDPGPRRLLLVAAWEPANPLATSNPLSWSLKGRFLALVPETGGPMLVSPAADARLPCRMAADEPSFTFSFPADTDPDGKALTFVALSRPAGASDLQLMRRPLDDTILKRSVADGRVTYVWRPSWRSQVGETRELRWEAEEIATRGSTFTWTVQLRHPDGVTWMAPPRQVHVLP